LFLIFCGTFTYNQHYMAHRFYNERWRRFRKIFLSENPLCVYCKAQGITEAATVVDHIKPHRGNYDLFWLVGNHQALCKQCHDGMKQKIDNGKNVKMFTTEGYPIGGGE